MSAAQARIFFPRTCARALAWRLLVAAALVIAAVAVNEAVEAWRGDACDCR